jgi:drug/metabolite transporter (DMT)-like permease
MRIALYWFLFLGQTAGDATILSQLIPLFRRLVTSGLDEKASPKILIFAALGVAIVQVCYWLDQYWGFVLLSAALFSIFCYTLELERLGRALVERKGRS